MLAQGLSPRTVAYDRAMLRRALGQAVKRGELPRVLDHATVRLASDRYVHYTKEIARRAAHETEAIFGAG
jgi:hypothetical protein